MALAGDRKTTDMVLGRWKKTDEGGRETTV